MYPVTVITICPVVHRKVPRQSGETFFSVAEVLAKIDDESISDEVHALFVISESVAVAVALHIARELQLRGLWVAPLRSFGDCSSMVESKIAV
jgi:hypothetical protein